MVKYTTQFLVKLEEIISESDYILRYEPVTHFGTRVDSLKDVLAQGWDAVFVGTGAAAVGLSRRSTLAFSRKARIRSCWVLRVR